MVMRIAQPLLETRFGKATVASLLYVGDLMIDVAHRVVGTVEWVFDKVEEGS
jgi:hypothetical protein